MLDFIFNNPKIKFGELMLWDERITQYIISQFPDYQGDKVLDYLALNPNLYSVHKVSYRGQPIPTFSFAEFNIEKSTVKVAIFWLLGSLKQKPNQQWQENFNKKIEIHTKNQISKILGQIVLSTCDNKPLTNFSTSTTTIHILLSQHLDRFRQQEIATSMN
ncbi:MAG: hypothetical protein F6K22_27530 [Okeania sp. SIO2F4]|uniref:hypothetical protein n=1 Tax=Okeania sp. SIO2F4 TaxID=2607790 RepID=UPI00142AF193|nr:hypothetical protein [Okeania sp. SIO2F4]NES06233.1 hypothetical protein [Okeania sp. SIO2F4]